MTAAAADVLGSAEVRLLTEIGFMACRARQANAAMAIFEGLRALRPRHGFVFLGLAMARMCAGRAEEAVRILRDEGLKVLPDDEELRVFLAIALKEARRESESRRVLQDLAGQAGQASAPRRLAASILAAKGDGLPEPAAPAAPAASAAGPRAPRRTV